MTVGIVEGNWKGPGVRAEPFCHFGCEILLEEELHGCVETLLNGPFLEVRMRTIFVGVGPIDQKLPFVRAQELEASRLSHAAHRFGAQKLPEHPRFLFLHDIHEHLICLPPRAEIRDALPLVFLLVTVQPGEGHLLVIFTRNIHGVLDSPICSGLPYRPNM